MGQAVHPRRIAVLSVHTSPLEQPGTGDAGGLNVYVVETARGLAAQGTEVEIFTRATSGGDPPVTELAPGVLVRHLPAGPLGGLCKDELPAQLCAFASGLLRVEARHDPGRYDLVHSHYWLSGQVGRLVAERWQVPLVHTMHTMAKVKNTSLAVGEAPEPRDRIVGEEQVVRASDRLLANTPAERGQLIGLYGADPCRVAVASPGVDLGTFCPGGPGGARAARRRLGIAPGARLLLFAGRIQALKAPDVLLRAAARIVAADPGLRDGLRIAVVGGPSGSGPAHPRELTSLARRLGIDGLVSVHPPTGRRELVDWYRAADLVAVPSYSESFGLVAIEAQACGTPVVAAAVGGLPTTVADGVSGLLVHGHDPDTWAAAIGGLLADRPRLDRMRSAAVAHAQGFGWDATVEATLRAYRGVLHRGPRHGDSARSGGVAVVPRPALVAGGPMAVAP